MSHSKDTETKRHTSSGEQLLEQLYGSVLHARSACWGSTLLLDQLLPSFPPFSSSLFHIYTPGESLPFLLSALLCFISILLVSLFLFSFQLFFVSYLYFWWVSSFSPFSSSLFHIYTPGEYFPFLFSALLCSISILLVSLFLSSFQLFFVSYLYSWWVSSFPLFSSSLFHIYTTVECFRWQVLG